MRLKEKIKVLVKEKIKALVKEVLILKQMERVGVRTKEQTLEKMKIKVNQKQKQVERKVAPHQKV